MPRNPARNVQGTFSPQNSVYGCGIVPTICHTVLLHLRRNAPSLIRIGNSGQIALLLPLGAALGVVAILPIALALALRQGEHDLGAYAARILHVEELTAQETRAALAAVAGDHQAFCSDAELAVMRDFVFHATFVRDIGRVKDGNLVCTSVQGRLREPMPTTPGEITLGQTQLRRLSTLSLISPQSTGIIIYSQNTSIVLNRGVFDSLDEPPMLSTGLVYDREHGRVFPTYGHDEPLTDAEVLAARPVFRDGTYYLPICSARDRVCAIAAETRSALFGRNREEFAGVLVDGALLGSTITAVALLLVFYHRSMERRLRRAIRGRQLTCVYQPMIDLDTGACVGGEALARWTTESGESVPPDVFVRVAEEKGIVGELTRLVLGRVLEDLQPFLKGEGFRIAVNIAAQDLSDPRFFAQLEESVRAAGVSPASLAFEITEHSTANLEMAQKAIAQLRQAGYAVFIDDFGTGYSSLAYLQDLRVDAIKVDRVFTQTVGTDAVTASVLPQILEMAERLGLAVVAEGLETEEQAEYFRKSRRGILGQGWLLGRAVAADNFKAFLATHPIVPGAPEPENAVS